MRSRMRRRVLIAAGALAATPMVARAQQPARTPVVAYLAFDNAQQAYDYFRDEMKRLGYVEGRNVVYAFRTAGGAVLANAPDPFTRVYVEQVQRAASALRLEVSPIMVRGAGEFDAAIAGMVKRRAQFVVVQPSLQRRAAAQAARRHRLPAIASSGTFADEGGLMSYAANFEEAHRGAAVYVDRILKGAKPADLPVQQRTRFDLVINLETARVLELTVPNEILARADRVIE